MRQIIIDFGTLELFGAGFPLRIYGYGLMMVLGFLVSIYLSQRMARRAGESPEVIGVCGILALAGGVLGARIAYVIENHAAFFAPGQNILAAILNVSSGGLIYYGGLILAVVLVTGYLLAKRLPVRRYMDIIAIAAMVGLAFGRAGCLLNGCCYGDPCRADCVWGSKFPMFSKPLLKLNGGAGPFSAGTESPSPPYGHQLKTGRVWPDARLVNASAPGPGLTLHAPRYLHGKLSSDQLSTLLAGEAAQRSLFAALAGPVGTVGPAQWRRGLSAGGGFLRGSEAWDEAVLFDRDGDGSLSFREARGCQEARKARLLKQFDRDRDGQLTGPEYDAANEYLQADLWALAESSWSMPVKPAQVLGLLNALVLAGLLWGYYRLRSREGQVLALLLVVYPISRWLMEKIRDQEHPVDNWTHNQYTSVLMAGCGLALWAALRRLPASAGPTWGRRLAAQSHGAAGAAASMSSVTAGRPGARNS